MRVKSFITTSANIAEIRIDEGAWKKIIAEKRENHWKTLHQNRNHVSLILCASFPHKPSF